LIAHTISGSAILAVKFKKIEGAEYGGGADAVSADKIEPG
jgi:hypothetical protein